MYKKCKIIMLPTNQDSLIGLYTDIIGDCRLYEKSHPLKAYKTWIPQHLYIISDEEIKEGDWFICNQAVQQCIKVIKDRDYPYKIINKFNGEIQYQFKTWKGVVIATTDKSLELPQPSQSFIEKYISEYNKGNILEEVEVEYKDCGTQDRGNIGNLIHIDTSGESFIMGHRLKLNLNNEINIETIKESWIREDFHDILEKFMDDVMKWSDLNTEATLLGQKGKEEPYVPSGDEFISSWIKKNL